AGSLTVGSVATPALCAARSWMPLQPVAAGLSPATPREACEPQKLLLPDALRGRLPEGTESAGLSDPLLRWHGDDGALLAGDAHPVGVLAGDAHPVGVLAGDAHPVGV